MNASDAKLPWSRRAPKSAKEPCQANLQRQDTNHKPVDRQKAAAADRRERFMWQPTHRLDPSPPGAPQEGSDVTELAREPVHPTVLLVEDEVVVNFFLKTLFEERGFQVVMTTTAAEAISAIADAQNELCAAVIDIGLPDQPGDQLVPLIRSSFPDLPIVIATGFSETEFDRRFQDDLRVRVIGKPFDGPHLFSVLSSIDEQFGG